jgi:uncharacterized protein (TIGR00725 family)
MAYQVAVCGPARCSDAEEEQARRVGELLAGRGAVVICGGGTGVMAGAAAAARAAGGLVIGVVPGERSSLDLSATIATNMGQARNAIIVCSADAVIAIGGSWGTLSEIALAKRHGGIPVVALGGWRVLGPDGEVPGIEHVDSPAAAVAAVYRSRTSTVDPNGPVSGA